MPEATPIKKGLEPRFDIERELVDYFTVKVRNFAIECGEAPQAVAIVLIGDNKSDQMHTIASSWSPDNSKSRFETCSIAATLMTQRAIRG